MNNEGEILKDGESRSDDAVDAMLHELALTSDEWMRKPTVFDERCWRASLHRVKSSSYRPWTSSCWTRHWALQEHLPRNRAVSLRDRQAPPVAPHFARPSSTGGPQRIIGRELQRWRPLARPSSTGGQQRIMERQLQRWRHAGPTLIDGQPAQSDVTEAPKWTMTRFNWARKTKPLTTPYSSIFKNLIRGMSTTKAELTPARQEFQDALLDAVKTNTTRPMNFNECCSTRC